MRGFKDTLAFSMKQGPFNRLSHLPNAFLFTQVLNDWRMSPLSPTCPWAENVPFARSFWSHLITLRPCGYADADADRQRPWSGESQVRPGDGRNEPMTSCEGPSRSPASRRFWREIGEGSRRYGYIVAVPQTTFKKTHGSFDHSSSCPVCSSDSRDPGTDERDGGVNYDCDGSFATPMRLTEAR